MKKSAWFRGDVPGGKVITSQMRVADGAGGFSRRATPLFDLGTVPAGNLYTTAGDLARFVAMWAADGDAPGGRVLKAGTLTEMWKPQLEAKGGFGLGFALGEWRGRRTVGHGGAVFGHSTALTFLPQEKIGVVVLCNEDIVNARTQRLANLALSLMLEAKLGEKPPAAPAAFNWSAAELVVHEKFGRLYATTENMVDYRLTPVNRHVFALPPGMYAEEEVVFLAGPDGRCWAVDFANMLLPRSK